MGETTGISWTDSTWSPLRGCSVASPGCENCYAAGIAARFSGPGLPFEGFAKRSAKRGLPQWTGKVELRPEHLADPLRWRKGRRIFVSSMSDVFHEELSNEDIAAIFGVMAAAPRHTFQVLTKRAKRMREWFEWVADHGSTGARSACRASAGLYLGRSPEAEPFGAAWPLPNVWLGVSVEDQKRADERIPELLATPAVVRFISAEPLLEGLDLFAFLNGPVRDASLKELGAPPMPGLDWIIAGFESGPRARPGHVSWLYNMVVDCEDAKIPLFIKQLGANAHEWTETGTTEDLPDEQLTRPPFDDARLVRRLALKDRAGGDPSEWPAGLDVREMPEARR